MDVSSIAQAATTIAETGLRQEVAVSVLRKAMDIEAGNAAALIAALPPVSGHNLPPHLGQHIDTTA